jgi:hypothetical protein
MEPKKPSLPKKIWVATSIVILLLTALALSLGWFNHRRSLHTMTEIHQPVRLYIRAGHGEDMARLYLGDIDVDSGTSADYVFSVETESKEGYILQLAHTTNIPFTYEIYRATEVTEQTTAAVPYEGEDGTVYYYTSSAKLDGAYLNETNDTGLANADYHQVTYGDYSYVQKNAEPLYWQTVVTPGSDQAPDDQELLIDYFILHITWENTGSRAIQNDKETDVIYLTVGRNATVEDTSETQ